MGNHLLRPEQVAETLECGRTRVYDLIRTGELHSVKVGRLRRVPAESVDDFVRKLRLTQGGDVPQP